MPESPPQDRIVDAHQHFWRYSPRAQPWIDETMVALRADFLPADLEPELARHGIAGTVAVQAAQTGDETRFLLELADRHPFVLGVVGWVDLRAADVQRQVEALAANPRLVGFRHLVQDEPDDRFLLREDFRRGLVAVGKAGLAYDLLVYPRQLPAAIELLRELPEQRLVLDHLAKPPIRDGALHPWQGQLRELARYPHLACKVSGLVTEADHRHWQPADLRPYLETALEAFGPDRLMFGSDWPVCLLAADYGRVLEVVTDFVASLSPAERAAVLGGTAGRCYRLPVSP